MSAPAASENHPRLAEHELEVEDEDEDHEHDSEHPITQHSTIPSGRAFIFSQANSRSGDALISSADDPDKVIYECAVTVSIDHSKPKIVISSDGRVIAHVFHHWTTGFKIGVDPGGSGNERAMQWVEMKKGGFTALNRSFAFDWQGKVYVMARMRESSLGVTGRKKWLRHYKVVEKESSDVVATYLTETSIGKRTGTLTLKQDVDRDLGVIILAGIAEWREMARRQQMTMGAALG